MKHWGWAILFLVTSSLRLWCSTLPFDPDYVSQAMVSAPARVSGNAVLGLLTNPAELAWSQQHGMWLLATNPLEDTQLIQLQYLFPTTLGALGFGMTHWTVNNIPQTVMSPRPTQTGMVTDTITSFRLGYSVPLLSDTLSAGLTARYGIQNLASREAFLSSLDVGVKWYMSPALSLGVSLKNVLGMGWKWTDSQVQEDLVSDIAFSGAWNFQLCTVGAEVTRFQNTFFSIVPLGAYANAFGTWQSASYSGPTAGFGVQIRLMDYHVLYQMTIPMTEGFDVSHQLGLSMNFGSPFLIQLPKISWRRDPFLSSKVPVALGQSPNADSGALTEAESKNIGVIMIKPQPIIFKAIQAEIADSEANWQLIPSEVLQARMARTGLQPGDLGNKDDAVALADDTRCGLLLLAEVLPTQSDFRYQFRVYDAVMEKWYTAKITLSQHDMDGFHIWFQRLLDAILKKRG